jgi:hypothetical protein
MNSNLIHVIASYLENNDDFKHFHESLKNTLSQLDISRYQLFEHLSNINNSELLYNWVGQENIGFLPPTFTNSFQIIEFNIDYIQSIVSEWNYFENYPFLSKPMEKLNWGLGHSVYPNITNWKYIYEKKSILTSNSGIVWKAIKHDFVDKKTSPLLSEYELSDTRFHEIYKLPYDFIIQYYLPNKDKYRTVVALVG